MRVGENMSETTDNFNEFELSQRDLDEFFEFADKFVNDLNVLYNNSSEFIIGDSINE